MAQPAVSTAPVQLAVPLPATPPVTRIRPSQGKVWPALLEVIHYRELLYFLAWRDLKVRYKQTVLGAAWAIIQPLFMMLIFTLVFGRLARIPTPVPYPIFALSGLLPWQLFAFGLTQSSQSLVGSQHLITKVYFPRLVVPFSSVIAGLVDFGIAFLLLIAMMVWYRVMPSWTVLLVPAFVVIAVMTALAAGLWLSALNVRYRDVHHTLGFLAQLWMLGTPVAYAINLVPQPWRTVIALNPMTSVVEGFRWALLGKGHRPGWEMAVSLTMVAVTFIGGLIYFRKVERTLADVV